MLTRREEQTPTHRTHPRPQEAVLSLVPCVLAERSLACRSRSLVCRSRDMGPQSSFCIERHELEQDFALLWSPFTTGA